MLSKLINISKLETVQTKNRSDFYSCHKLGYRTCKGLQILKDFAKVSQKDRRISNRNEKSFNLYLFLCISDMLIRRFAEIFSLDLHVLKL